MTFDQPNQLSNLVRFCFAANFLQIKEFWNSLMDKNVVAPVCAGKLESKAFRQSDNICEAYVV